MAQNPQTPQVPLVLATTRMAEAGMGLLREACTLRMASATDPETLHREIVEADALVVRTAGRYDTALMDAAPRLKVIGRHGVGFDHIDVEEATRRGIVVVSTPGANTESVCQHALGLMIGLSKHWPRTMEALKQGDFHSRTRHVGRNLTGRTLGIVGFGRIGSRVAEVCHQAFAMPVLYHDIREIPQQQRRPSAAEPVSFDVLLQRSEYVSLHVPLDDSTRNLIDRRTLAAMRTDAILINTCRGPVVDESAVAEALEAGRLLGYGADVYAVEPPPTDHPLIGRPDCFLTPHSAAQTLESLRNMATWVAQDVLRVLRGETPFNPVNDLEAVARARAERSAANDRRE